MSMAAWRRDHTLASAMRDSVLWYFQRVAERLGAAREREYLKKFDYGNADPTSGLTTFWLGGSLQISPEEQLRFMRRLYAGESAREPRRDANRQAIARPAAGARRRMPPAGTRLPPHGPLAPLSAPRREAAPIVAARPFAGWWGTWRRGPRSWVFVSTVAGASDTPALAAVNQAASALRDEGVLR